MSFGGLLEGLSPGFGAVSTGFCVSVGWPVTSPGFEDMPGSVVVPWSPLVLGAAGRATLPEVPWSALPLLEPVAEPVVEFEPEVPSEPLLLELEPMEPLALDPVSVPDVVELLLLSSADGAPSGEVRVRCIELVSLELRPWPCLWCFLCFFCTEVSLVASSLLPDLAEPLTAESSLSELFDEVSFPIAVLLELEPVEGVALEELSLLDALLSDGSVDLEVEVSEPGVVLLDGLLLGSVELLLAELPELPGSALLF